MFQGWAKKKSNNKFSKKFTSQITKECKLIFKHNHIIKRLSNMSSTNSITNHHYTKPNRLMTATKAAFNLYTVKHWWLNHISTYILLENFTFKFTTMMEFLNNIMLQKLYTKQYLFIHFLFKIKKEVFKVNDFTMITYIVSHRTILYEVYLWMYVGLF